MQIHNDIVNFTGPMEPAPVWGGLHIRPRQQRTFLHLNEIEAFIEEDTGDDGEIQRFVCTVGGQAYPIGYRDFYELHETWSEWRSSIH